MSRNYEPTYVNIEDTQSVDFGKIAPGKANSSEEIMGVLRQLKENNKAWSFLNERKFKDGEEEEVSLLHFAARNHMNNLASSLLTEFQMDPNIKNDRGENALNYLIRTTKKNNPTFRETLRVLAQGGVSINEPDESGRSALENIEKFKPGLWSRFSNFLLRKKAEEPLSNLLEESAKSANSYNVSFRRVAASVKSEDSTYEDIEKFDYLGQGREEALYGNIPRDKSLAPRDSDKTVYAELDFLPATGETKKTKIVRGEEVEETTYAEIKQPAASQSDCDQKSIEDLYSKVDKTRVPTLPERVNAQKTEKKGVKKYILTDDEFQPQEAQLPDIFLDDELDNSSPTDEVPTSNPIIDISKFPNFNQPIGQRVQNLRNLFEGNKGNEGNRR